MQQGQAAPAAQLGGAAPVIRACARRCENRLTGSTAGAAIDILERRAGNPGQPQSQSAPAARTHLANGAALLCTARTPMRSPGSWPLLPATCSGGRAAGGAPSGVRAANRTPPARVLRPLPSGLGPAAWASSHCSPPPFAPSPLASSARRRPSRPNEPCQPSSPPESPHRHPQVVMQSQMKASLGGRPGATGLGSSRGSQLISRATKVAAKPVYSGKGVSPPANGAGQPPLGGGKPPGRRAAARVFCLRTATRCCRGGAAAEGPMGSQRRATLAASHTWVPGLLFTAAWQLAPGRRRPVAAGSPMQRRSRRPPAAAPAAHAPPPAGPRHLCRQALPAH